MAIAVLVSSPSEAERVTAIGLDLAARMNTTAVFLCVQPDPALEKVKPKTDKAEKKSDKKAEKPKVDKSPDEPAESVPRFSEINSYVESTRTLVMKHIGTMIYGFVKNDVVEIPHIIDDIRKWICDPHQSEALGHYKIDTLVIPTLRAAGLEHAMESKDQLFEVSQLRTIFLSVDPATTGRLPLNNIGVTGLTQCDILNASRFARELSNVRVTRLNDEQREEGQQCVVAALEGKAGQTRIDKDPIWKALRKDSSLPVAIMLNPADNVGERVQSAVDYKMRTWFKDYQLSREDRMMLSNKLEKGAASSPEFILFMAVATFLACIGLIQDSAAVIIGAMLVAPLMTPLLGAGLALIFGNKPLFGKAVRSILLGVAIAFLIGTVVGLFSLCVPSYLFSGSGLCLTNEMISRSQPNILDPFIGLAAGLAGGFAIGRDGQIGTVAGVAIAAALVPPIATAGLECSLAIYCAFTEGDVLTFFRLLRQNPHDILASNGVLNSAPKSMEYVHLITAPLILFALNACATIIGAFIGLRMVGMHRAPRARQSRKWVFVFILALLLAIIVLMAIPALI